MKKNYETEVFNYETELGKKNFSYGCMSSTENPVFTP